MTTLAAGHAVTPAQIQTWLQDLLNCLQQSNQRLLLSVQGSDNWCNQHLDTIRAETDKLIVISDALKGNDVTANSKTETLLGNEARAVVLDLSTGLNPDAICIAAGLVKKGGLLVLMSCPVNQWNDISDQYGIWQDGSRSREYSFINYFFNELEDDAQCYIRLIESEPLPSFNQFPAGLVTEIINGKSLEQQSVLRKLKSWALVDRQPIALICADRGRGKSTCLGFVVAELQDKLRLSVLVTAYAKQSAAILLNTCAEARFIAPDQLITSASKADVLIIDEAAMLPYTMLSQLCKRFNKVIMATTTGGYEGSGQGFLLRFIARFEQDQVLKLNLQNPVRWAQNDLLEQWLNASLLLTAGESLAPSPVAQIDEIKYRVLTHSEFSRDQTLVKRIYSLMVTAHYRTRPSDLRLLMENPDLSVIIAEIGINLVGITLLNREGGLDRNLSEAIFLGKRRPRGHLLAQMITAQAGISDFASYRGFRILRIAVLESIRQKGIGRNMINRALDYTRSCEMDYLGACFGLDALTATFWQRVGFSFVHIGFGMGKSTGSHSIAVVRPLTDSVDKSLLDLQAKIRSQLAVWFCQFLRRMNPPEVISLIQYIGYEANLSHLEREEVRAFTLGHKGFELCFASLQKYLMQFLAKARNELQLPDWVIQKVIQNHAWEDLIAEQNLVGRKQIQNRLRIVIGNMTDQK